MSPEEATFPVPEPCPLFNGLSEDLYLCEGMFRRWWGLTDGPERESYSETQRALLAAADEWVRILLDLWGLLPDPTRAVSISSEKHQERGPGDATVAIAWPSPPRSGKEQVESYDRLFDLVRSDDEYAVLAYFAGERFRLAMARHIADLREGPEAVLDVLLPLGPVFISLHRWGWEISASYLSRACRCLVMGLFSEAVILCRASLEAGLGAAYGTEQEPHEDTVSFAISDGLKAIDSDWSLSNRELTRKKLETVRDAANRELHESLGAERYLPAGKVIQITGDVLWELMRVR